eukprot:GHVP01026875.1.p1 GENE.GHVP01026875.1~~GHVP01026875.1.p1  ORF type:complete len:234 (+),score=35.79 GHVP01026875.1:35-703(+)
MTSKSEVNACITGAFLTAFNGGSLSSTFFDIPEVSFPKATIPEAALCPLSENISANSPQNEILTVDKFFQDMYLAMNYEKTGRDLRDFRNDFSRVIRYRSSFQSYDPVNRTAYFTKNEAEAINDKKHLHRFPQKITLKFMKDQATITYELPKNVEYSVNFQLPLPNSTNSLDEEMFYLACQSLFEVLERSCPEIQLPVWFVNEESNNEESSSEKPILGPNWV